MKEVVVKLEDDLFAECEERGLFQPGEFDLILREELERRNNISEAWNVEIERRVEEIESGKVKTISGEQVFAEINRRLKAKGFNIEPKPKEFNTKQ